MQPTLYRVEHVGSGGFALMGRPRAGDWVSEEFAGLRKLGATDIVSLLESKEAYEIGLADEASYCTETGMRFHSYPIADRGVPVSPGDFSRFACQIYHLCAGGSYVVIHCRAGIGRSGLLGAAILLHGGQSPFDAFATISKARGVNVPDTSEQAEWLSIHQSTIMQCHLERKRW